MNQFADVINAFPNEIGKIDYVKDISLDIIKQVDTENMYQLLIDYWEHIKNAINNASPIVDSDNLVFDKERGIRRIVIIGIGGSAMAGELLKSYLQMHLKTGCPPITIIRDAGVPLSYSNAAVFCCSYSGNTEETLNTLKKNSLQNKNRNNIVFAVTSGGKLEEIAIERGYELLKLPTGMMPRCAMFYSFFHLLYSIIRLEMIPSRKKEKKILYNVESILESNDFKVSLDYSNIDNNNIALVLARCCQNKIPIIYTGKESLEAVNLRWKSQIQENANQLCFGNYFPELNHNEINGWMFPSDLLNRFIVIAMRDAEDSAALNKAMCSSLNLLIETGIEVIEVVVAGDSLLERLIRLICIADWVSFYLAIMNNIDPTPIPIITKLKNDNQ